MRVAVDVLPHACDPGLLEPVSAPPRPRTGAVRRRRDRRAASSPRAGLLELFPLDVRGYEQLSTRNVATVSDVLVLSILELVSVHVSVSSSWRSAHTAKTARNATSEATIRIAVTRPPRACPCPPAPLSVVPLRWH